MKIFELMNVLKVKDIAIRLCDTLEQAKNYEYKDTTLVYWGDLDDCLAEYCKYDIISTKVRDNTLFCWCVKKDLLISDIITKDLDNEIKVYNYISLDDVRRKDHSRTVEILLDKNLKVHDIVINGETVNIYVFLNNLKSNIFDDYNKEKGIEFRNV